MADSSDSILVPGPDAPAEPFYAVMHVDDEGNTDGKVWSYGKRLMLMSNRDLADKIITMLGKQDKDNKYGARGVTKGHLEAIKGSIEGSEVEIFVIENIEGGAIEAVPIADHQ